MPRLFPRRASLRLCLALTMALLPGMGLAQDAPAADPAPAPAEAPLITLPAPDLTPPPPPRAAAPVPPVIDLAPATAATPLPDLTPVPVERDRAPDAPAMSAVWLMPFFPATALPAGVQIGASLSEPGILRLTGETATTELALVLPEGTPPPEALAFTLRSGVNVLTDTATMAVSVNGADPVSVPLQQLDGFATVQVPVTALTTGENRIALTLRQPHRIFCGPEASFAVWTEIDLATSGAGVPPDTLGTDAAGFALALRSQIAGGRAVSLLADAQTDPAVLRRVSDALAQGLSGQGRIDIRSFYAIGPQPFAAVALIASDKVQASFRRGASGAIILQIEYQGDRLPDLSAVLPASVAPVAGLAQVQPGQPHAISGFGAGDIIGNTHYFRRELAFGLPDKWLLMANQKARLDLRYGFARNLPEGAILLVKVNGETIRLLPLDRDGGEILPPLPVSFDANLLHPGRNTLVFEMMAPGAPADEICPVRRADMLVVMGDSTLTVPPSPAMLLPGLAVPLAGLAPGAVLAPPGAAEHAALEQLAIRLGSGLARPVDPDPAVSLTVARLGDLALVPTDDTGVTHRLLQDLLFPPAAPLPDAATAAAPATPSFRLSEDDDAPAPDTGPGLMSRFGTWVGRAFTREGWLWQEVEAVARTAFVASDQDLPEWLAARTGRALLWRPDPAMPDALWLILGPDVGPDEVSAALNRLTTGGAGMGEAALLQADGNWQVWTPIRPPALLETPGLGNLRTVLGNYASWSPLLFMLATLVLALLSALPALLYVLLTRRQGGGQ